MSSTAVEVDFGSFSPERLFPSFGNLARVSNNLEGYFLFCLFGLAILALFLCRSSMQD